jgi:hypothetical protein
VRVKVVRDKNAQRVFLRVSDSSDFGTGTSFTDNETDVATSSVKTGTITANLDYNVSGNGNAEIVTVVGKSDNEQVVQTLDYTDAQGSFLIQNL